jgi:hypothetical protein
MSLALALSQTLAKQNWRLSMDVNTALKKVRDNLISGKIKEKQFDISRTFKKTSCGTVACIGGWAYVYIMGGATRVDTEEAENFIYKAPPDLHALFFPGGDCQSDINWYDITPAHAVKAIDMYLTTGKVDWQKAMEPAHV